MRQNDVATRGEQDVRRPRHPRNPRILDVLVNLNILNRRGELESFALSGLDIHVVDDEAVRLTEECSFGGADGDIAKRDVPDLHLRQTIEINGAFDIRALDVLDDDILKAGVSSETAGASAFMRAASSSSVSSPAPLPP